jgi:HK97 family phage major capsid protein
MKSRYQALVQKRADLLKIAGKADDESSTADELAAAKTALGEISAVDAELAQLDTLREAQRNAPGAAARVTSVHDNGDDDPKAGFRDLADFAASVIPAGYKAGAVIDQRLLRLGATADPALETGTKGEGYLVPAAMREEIWKVVYAQENLLSVFNPEPTSANAVEIVVDETTPWGTDGIRVYWVAEGAGITQSKANHRKALVKLHKLGALLPVSDELATDAPRLRNILAEKVPAALGHVIDEAIVGGNGIGKPLGFKNSPALITVNKETGQQAATFVAKNAGKMYGRLVNPTRGFWLHNKGVVSELLSMTVGNQPIWIPPSGSLQDAPGGFLIGRPMRQSRHCEALGTTGDVMFIDPTGYAAFIHSSGLKFQSSIHLWFDQDLEALRWTIRVGGMPVLSTPITPDKGDTESHFVLLQTRA